MSVSSTTSIDQSVFSTLSLEFVDKSFILSEISADSLTLKSAANVQSKNVIKEHSEKLLFSSIKVSNGNLIAGNWNVEN